MPKLTDPLSFWSGSSTPSKYWIKYSWSGSTHILYYIKMSVRWNTLLRNQISSCRQVFYYTAILGIMANNIAVPTNPFYRLVLFIKSLNLSTKKSSFTKNLSYIVVRKRSLKTLIILWFPAFKTFYLYSQTMKEGCEYKTVTLKWCTPRGSCGSELQHCIAATRITPTDVNSRPSSCLTNFLLAGRSVMLEMPRRSGY